MRAIIAFIIAATLLCSVGYAAPIQKYEEVIPITPGITLTKIQEFHSDQSISYSYIKADLTDENTKLKLLKSENGIDVVDTVNNLAKTEEDVVAAINGDFFSIQSGNKGFSLGIEIEDGALNQSPINPSTMATVAYLDNTLAMSYLDFNISIVAPNGESNAIRHLNKHTTYYGDILMYTKGFNGGMSPAPGGEVVEVLVDDGKIVEFRRNMPPVEIPENGCVLVISEGVNMFLANNFNVGDEVEFEYNISPDIKEAEVAFGGGAMLVEDGAEVSEFSHTVSGYQPRSAIGVTEDGKTMYIVAVDGRQDISRGMSMPQLAKLMVSLGCHNAVNLDGGGSTNMVASTMWNPEIHTVNSKTENRKVINAIGLTYTAESDGKVKNIELKTDKDTVFVGHPVKVSVAVYDSNMRPVSDKVDLSSDYGTIKDGVFIPERSGEAIVKAKCGGVSAQTSVYVVDTVAGIETDSYIRLENGGNSEFTINAFDSMGHYVSVTNTEKFGIYSSDEKVVSVDGRRLTAHSNGTAMITVKKDDAVSYISVAVDDSASEKEIKFKAPSTNLYSQNLIPSHKTMVVGTVCGDVKNLISGFVNSKVRKEMSNNPDGVVIGDLGEFKNYETENALCINVDTSSGGIRNTSPEQWNKIVDSISKSQKKNVFVFSDNSIFGSSDFENKVIKDYFSTLDRNVFIVTAGENNTYKNINGVNYFTVGNQTGVSLDLGYLSNYKYLVFHFGENVTFEWKNWF